MEVAATAQGLPPGTRFGRFAVVRPMAGGGMAEVYLGVDADAEPRARTPVAIKRLLPHMAWDPVYVRMFLDEVRIASGLNHPNIVRVLDFGVGEGGQYFAMEYLHGVTALSLLRDGSRHGGIPLSVAVRIVLQVAAGLEYAHGLELVHRDVSPSNVMVTHDGEVKLVDFGIARMRAETRYTRAGTLKGKIGYMSPEQCRGENVDQRSDIFGLGILLYELTVGRRAFYGDNDYGVINRIVEGDYRSPTDIVPSYPKALAQIVARALAVELDERYASVHAMAADLRALGYDESPAGTAAVMASFYARPPMPALDLPEPPRRSLRAVALVGGALALGLGGFFVGNALQVSKPEADARPETQTEASVETPSVSAAPAEPVVEPPIDEPDIEEPSAPSPEESQSTTRARSRPKVKRRAKKARSKPAAPATKKGPGDSLLPPSWHDE